MTDRETLREMAGCATRTPRDRRNQRQYQRGMLLWAVAYVASTFLIVSQWVTSEMGGIALALLPSLIAIVPARAFFRFLREADELQRQLQLQALAAALVAAFVIYPVVGLLDRVGVSLGGWRNDVVPMIVIFTYMASTIAGNRRYR